LFVGTRADNIADMVSKGRNKPAYGDLNGRRKHPQNFPVGEKSPKASLRLSEVFDILNKLREGKSQSSIARGYGVARCTIGKIHRGETWAAAISGNPHKQNKKKP